MTSMLVNYWSLQEQIRHNLVAEKELNRHNVASEQISGNQVSLGYAQLGEAMRHNKIMEQRVDYQNAADATRSMSSVMSSLGTIGYFKDKDNNTGQGGTGGKYLAESKGGKYLTGKKDTVKGQSAPSFFETMTYDYLHDYFGDEQKSLTLTDVLKNAFALPVNGLPFAVPGF